METCSEEDISLGKYGKAGSNENLKVMAERAKDQRVIVVLRGKVIAIKVYLKKQEKSPKNSLTIQLKEVGGGNKQNPK